MDTITHSPRLAILVTLIATVLSAACSSGQITPESTRTLRSDNTLLTHGPTPASHTVITQTDIPAQEPSNGIAVDDQEITCESVTDVPASRPARLVFTFGFNQARLNADHQKIVEQHGRFLAEHPEFRLIINGHADPQGDSRYNDLLAQKRAEHVADVLMSQGAMREQIEILGWGSSAPLAGAHPNRELRRVELKYEDEYLVHFAVE